MGLRFVHAADLHLDSPLSGLARYDGAPVEQIRGATRRALANLVDLVLEEDAQLLLIAGDLYDGDWRDYSTGLFFASQMSRLRESGARVVWIRGNHDAKSRITRDLRLPPHVHELSTRAPQTLELPELGVAVHGQGFARERVTTDLSEAYPEPIAGAFNIGLLHTALSGREGHAAYAPCSVDALAHRGYAYWALGHVHAREVVREEPWIVFPGNLQGRHARETGPRGATLVEVEDGRVVSVRARTLDVVRWERVGVCIEEATAVDDVLQLCRDALEARAEAAGGRVLAVRLEVHGASQAHGAVAADPDGFEASLRVLASDLAGGDVWLEKLRLRSAPTQDLDSLCARDDALGALLRAIVGVGDDPERFELLRRELDQMLRKLPAEVRGGDQGLRPGDEQLSRELLDEVERLVVPRLLGAS